MSLPFAIFVLAVLLAFTIVGSGLFSSQKLVGVALFSLVVAVLATGGAFYAWAESSSVLWAIGYGSLAVASLGSATRQLIGNRVAN